MLLNRRNNKAGMILNLAKDTSGVKLKKYQALYANAITEILPSLNYYKYGEFGDLNTEFTNEKYTEVGKTLANNALYTDANVERISYKNTTFNEIKRSFHNVLDGLQRGKIQHTSMVECDTKVANYEDILGDPKKLEEYYKQKFQAKLGTFEELNANADLDIAPSFNRKYELYVERHGLPINGMFDSELLSRIVLELEG